MKYFFALTALTMIFSSCIPGKKSETSDKISVVATIGMITDAASELGGSRVKVQGLMGAGVDPHFYKASAGDIQRLQNADLILYNGLHLEARMAEVLEQLSKRRAVVAVAEALPESQRISDPEFGGSYDPHIWFDVSKWSVAVDAVAKALIEVDPEGEEIFLENLKAYQLKLTALDESVRQTLSAVKTQQRILITAHDAFGYFGKAYDFEVRGLQGISTVSETGARDVQKLANFIAGNRIGALFVESSVPRKNIEALQAAVQSRGFDVQIGGELFSDAMGEEGSFEGSYIGMITHNANIIAAALGGKN